MFFKERGSRIKIKNVISDLKEMKPSLVHMDTSIEDVIKIIIGSESDKILYVVDNDNQLIGTISIDELIRNIFSSSHEVKIHPRRLMDIVTSETAIHIMKKNPSFIRKDDYLDYVIKKMIKAHVKHIALVDEAEKIIGDISIVDLIRILLKINHMSEFIEA